MKRKFEVGDEVMSRGVCDMWSAAVVTSYDGNGYYYVAEKTGPSEGRPYLAHAMNLRRSAKSEPPKDERHNRDMKTPTKKKDYRYIVTAVDTSDSADGKARVLKACRTRKAAEAFVSKDMDGYLEDGEGMDLVVDEAKMSVHTKDYSYGCEWAVERVEV